MDLKIPDIGLYIAPRAELYENTIACIPSLSPREKMLGSRLIANYVSRTVYINTEVSEIQYYT